MGRCPKSRGAAAPRCPTLPYAALRCPTLPYAALRGRGVWRPRPRPGGGGAGPLLDAACLTLTLTLTMRAVLKLDPVLERARRDIDALHSAQPGLAW